MRQAGQHFANARAADAEDLGQTFLDQLGAGVQAVLQDRDIDLLVDLVLRVLEDPAGRVPEVPRVLTPRQISPPRRRAAIRGRWSGGWPFERNRALPSIPLLCTVVYRQTVAVSRPSHMQIRGVTNLVASLLARVHRQRTGASLSNPGPARHNVSVTAAARPEQHRSTNPWGPTSLRVLIVDDCPDHRWLARDLLSQFGIEPTMACNGA